MSTRAIFFQGNPIHACPKMQKTDDVFLIKIGDNCPFCGEKLIMPERYDVEEHGDKGRTRHGSPTFYALLSEMAGTHDRKSHDYASDDNPCGNYHFAGQLALLFAHSAKDAGFIGRLGEKLYRLANLESSGKAPQNESIEDTEVDLCVIMALWMSDRRDRRRQSSLSSPPTSSGS